MERLTLATRTFLFSFVPIAILLVASFLAVHGAVHQRVRQDLRAALRDSDELLNRANADFSWQNSKLLAKLTDSAGLKASIGLLAEGNHGPTLDKQVQSTIEAQLWELQNASSYDFVAVGSVAGATLAEVPATASGSGSGSPVFSQLAGAQSGLVLRQGVLFQVQSVPVEIGGETAAFLMLGRRFDLARLASGGYAVLMKSGKIVRTTFPPADSGDLASQLAKNCPKPEAGCEVAAAGESYVVSLLQRDQLGAAYQLLGFRSLDAPLSAFDRAFLPVLIELGLAGVFLALICTFVTSRSVSRPLRFLAMQLESAAAAGTLPEKLDAKEGVKEVDLLAGAFNRVADSERRSRSELVLAKHAAESANRLKTEFLTNVSHELRTPLNGVLGMTELLLTTQLTEEQTQYAGTIQQSGVSLATLIDEILDFSELETGRLRLKFADMNPHRIFEDLVQVTQSRLGKKPVTLEASCADDMPIQVIGDETRIRQALMHLCDNAVKFTDAGFIRIAAQYLTISERDAALTFSVEDTGIGIAPENMERLFQHFTQIDGSLTRRRGGTGLGLSITKALVELMGGRIDLKSNPNFGSVFWFTVPVQLPLPVEKGSTNYETVGVP